MSRLEDYIPLAIRAETGSMAKKKIHARALTLMSYFQSNKSLARNKRKESNGWLYTIVKKKKKANTIQEKHFQVRKWFQQRVVLGSILSIMRTCNIRSYTVERCTHQDKLSISIISSRKKKYFWKANLNVGHHLNIFKIFIYSRWKKNKNFRIGKKKYAHNPFNWLFTWRKVWLPLKLWRYILYI